MDRVCLLAFANLLPGCRVQKMGSPALDGFIMGDALGELPVAVDRHLRSTR
ncbi:MAG: hypothetical protein ACOC1F_02140 [Myxococcota bacterium]